MTTEETPISEIASEVLATGKAPWKSKTLWAAAIACAVPFIPHVGPIAAAWIKGNPGGFSAALGVLFATLRLVSHGKISVS